MFFSQLFGSQSTPGSGGWLSGIGGARSEAGQIVTPDTALALTALQNCVTLLAESIAQLPLELYRRTAEGQREVARDHSLYRVLAWEPNEWQTPFEYREQGQIAAGLRGNAISLIDRDPDGTVTALYPVTDPVQVLRGNDRKPYYRINGAEPIPQRMVHHVRWISLNSYFGLSPIVLHANAIGHAQAIRQYAGKSFLNGTALSGVIERPRESPPIKEQSAVDKLVDEWQRKYGGSENAKKVALLQEGMTFKPLSMTNVDADLIAALKLTSLEIARIYKVPPHMIGELDKATFSNIEHQAIQFVIYTLLPWIKRHEQAMMRDFLLPSERAEYYIEFNVSGLLRGDQSSRFAAYAVARQWGWLSVNDIRRLENLPPIAGGDVYLQPLNMINAAMPPTSVKPTAEQVAEIEGIVQ
ncbi:phage portal protein [Noviherbaspirillum saxi]|uniref:Phage portal protein n=1 Tax=Noviherbaspirillum saxi TaxID=2320863 RepID=A0A3A3FTA7_9BURK|nr:phage portal protein [Noviherbaspirillum saxi]RJF99023.1 phage portal protein [Noviherbaspirillum saxi]